MASSRAGRLICRDCRAAIDEAVVPLCCASCGGPASLPLPPPPPVAARAAQGRPGLWRYRPLLPLEDDDAIVTLGEGSTPVVALERWGDRVGVPGAWAKLEHIAPTGSFKDRGMTLVASRARELGARALVEDSSGNAGASCAAYAARGGMAATVYAPAAAPAAKLRQIEAAGARVVLVGGARQAVADAALEDVRVNGGYYVGHNVNPYFSIGMTTFAYELIERFAEGLPEHVVMPAGGGSLYVGLWQGLRHWLGPAARLPRLHLVQPSGCRPIVAAQEQGAGRAVAIERRPTIAGGAEIERPARDREMLAALADSNGIAIAVEDDDLRLERRRLAHLEGIDLEPTAALGPAGVVALARRGVFGRDERVLIATTGTGLKVPDG